MDGGTGHDSALAKQRFRWAFGTMQCLWKHRDLILNPRFGALGCFSLPSIVLFQILLVAAVPIVDLLLIVSLISGRRIALCRLFRRLSRVRSGACHPRVLDREGTIATCRVDHSHAIRISTDIELCDLALDLAYAARGVGWMGKAGPQGHRGNADIEILKIILLCLAAVFLGPGLSRSIRCARSERDRCPKEPASSGPSFSGCLHRRIHRFRRIRRRCYLRANRLV